MKTLIHCGLTFSLLIAHLVADDSPAKEKVQYRRLESTDDKARGVVRQLQAIKIHGVVMDNLAPSAALEALRKKVVGDEGGAVINFVIRGSEQGQKVNINADKMTYPQAIDEICAQTGRAWKIEFNDKPGTPILVIKNGNGKPKPRD
jgi:hypothetical protein